MSGTGILRNQRSIVAKRSGSLALAAWGRNSVPDAAGALAFSREHPADKRPELLLWFAASEDRYRELAIEHAALRLGLRYRLANPEAVAQAAIDAVDVVRPRSRGLKAPTTAQRAKQMGVRKATFAELRSAAVDYLRAAIYSGMERYVRASRDAEPATPAIRHSRSMQPIATPPAAATSRRVRLAISDIALRQEPEQLVADFTLSNGAVLPIPIPMPVFFGVHEAGVTYAPLSIVYDSSGLGWIARGQTSDAPGIGGAWEEWDAPETPEEARAWNRECGDLLATLIRAAARVLKMELEKA